MFQLRVQDLIGDTDDLRTFFFVALGVVVAAMVIVAAVRIWSTRRDSRERLNRLRESLKEICGDVAQEEWEFWVCAYDRGIGANYEQRHFTFFLPDKDRITVVCKDAPDEPELLLLPCVIRYPRVYWPWQWAGLSPVGRKTLPWGRDFGFYMPDVLAAYLCELGEAPPPPDESGGSVEDSLVVLRSLRGVKRFRIDMMRCGWCRGSFRLDSDDLLARPDLLESMMHHLARLRVLLSAGST
jgi:hypothetical protein